jgi:hypothetical protein
MQLTAIPFGIVVRFFMQPARSPEASMTPADVKDLSISRPLVSPWLLFVEPKPAAAPAAPADLPKAA